MIKLKNVSKFYYSKGVISSGFTKINLDFDMGEFVAITGESGSGKSTLLNVISGLDTYEEGEMYINGEETSHYTEKDFEEYRNKYIGNIFQTFNLINSYTVFQNVELVLLLSGMKKKEAKERALSLIEKVGLSEYRRTKASKLSGGQKQRVAIARALAKDTPIIIADEPTGNLDSESASGIIKLLSEIAKDKLVIIVTHNYDQVENYVTRKITMHDGKVISDYKIKEVEEEKEVAIPERKNTRFFQQIRLGFRNAFNLPVKFILLLLVFIFVSISLISQYSSMQESKFQESISGWNFYFNNTSENRIILKKMENEVAIPFTEEDFEKIRSLDNIDIVVEQDLLVDSEISLEDSEGYYYLYANIDEISNYKGSNELACGTMPVEDNEILVVATENNYYLYDELENYLSKTYKVYDAMGYKDGEYKITGVIYESTESNPLLTNNGIMFYGSKKLLDEILLSQNINSSTMTYTFQGVTYEDQGTMWHVYLSDKVALGTCVVAEDYDYLVEKTYKCKGKVITFNVKNKYFNVSKDLTIGSTYSVKGMKNYMQIGSGESYDWYYGYIFVNPSDYSSLFDQGTFQTSVFVKDTHMLDETINELKDLGYKTLALRDANYNDETSAILQLASNFMTIISMIIIFIIAYFVIRIILKSRNVYYSTIRMIGANINISRSLLVIELIIDATVSYLFTIALIYIGTIYAPNFGIVQNVVQYMNIGSFIVVYIILFVISLLISFRYSNRLFKKSTMKTIKEEI